MGNNLETMRNQWHPGFYGAAQLELMADKEILEFHREYNLSKEPLRIDLVIIKKLSERTVVNEIGRIFKKFNVIEYRSPDSSLSIDDYYKTVGYACLYKGLGEKVGEIPAEEVTVSIFRERYPREMMDQLRKQGFVIEKQFPGIYYIKGKGLFDTQIIVTSRLKEKAHRSLRVLSARVRKEDAEAFLRDADKLTEPGDRNNMEAVLQVSIAANRGVYEEIRRGSIMCEALRDLMKDVIEEEVAKEVAKEVAQERQKNQKTFMEAIRNLMANMKWTADQAMSAMSIPTEEWGKYKAML